MDPKMDPKIAQNARKARLRSGTLLGCILGSFLVDFWGHFGTLLDRFLEHFDIIFNNSCECVQIRADTSKKAQRHTKIHANTCKFRQILANTRRYVQIRPGKRAYVQIRANTCTHVQVHTNFVFYRVTSAARERAQRAQRAKRRKDTTSSHEQLQGAPFSSVRRHVPASLIIITRFPFTYQTGFQKGFQKGLFFGIDFCTDFGVDLGSYFGLNFHDFQYFFGINFLVMVFM